MDAVDSFTLNKFTFCTYHGHEYCLSCFCDFRAGNNDQVDLDEATIEKLEGMFLDFDDRPSLNAYAFGARIADNKGLSYKCRKHGTVNCEICFDWARLIIKSMAVVERLNATTDAEEGTKEAISALDGEERAEEGANGRE